MTGQATGTERLIRSRRDECEQWIERLATGPIDAAWIQQLRSRLGPSLAPVVLSAGQLQAKAVKKLGVPPARLGEQENLRRVWWVTEKSLQQATPWQVAQVKAGWVGHLPVFDLCCGIGGDAIQLAKQSSLVAIDVDPLVAAMAEANLSRVTTNQPPQVRCEEVTKTEIPPGTAVHIDPDRRADDHRTTRPHRYDPPWSEVSRIMERSGAAVVKLAPAARIDTLPPGPWHRCWISLQRTVREQTLLFGTLVDQAEMTPATHSAISLHADGTASCFAPARNEFTGSGTTRLDVVEQPLSVMIDPDPAIRSAGLTEAFARRYALKIVDRPSGFLTAEQVDAIDARAADMAVVGTVVWSGPCDQRKLRKALRERNAHVATVKVRGTDHNPSHLIQRFRKCGENPITLWIGRTASRVYAVLVE